MKSVYKRSKELFAEIRQMDNDTDKENAIFKAMLDLQTESRMGAISEYSNQN